MASNSATASLALFDCSEPTRCSSRSPWRARQRRPLGLGFLHPVFPEHALAGGNHRLDRIGAEGLCRPRSMSPSSHRVRRPGRGAGDFGANSRKPVGLDSCFPFRQRLANGSNFNGGPKIGLYAFLLGCGTPGVGIARCPTFNRSEPAEARRGANKPILSIRARLIVVALLGARTADARARARPGAEPAPSTPNWPAAKSSIWRSSGVRGTTRDRQFHARPAPGRGSRLHARWRPIRPTATKHSPT